MTLAPEPAMQPEQPIPVAAVPLLSLAAFASAISARVTDPMLPNLTGEFSVSLGSASSVITSFAVAYGLAQLFFGPLGDRYGKYLVVAWATIASGITAGLCAIAPNFWLLIVARLMAGTTAAALIPLSMAWIGDVVPYQQRQPVLARFLIGHILGLSTGAFFGGLAADVLSWRFPFVCVALLFLVVGIASLALNRRLPASARMVHKADGPTIPRMIRDYRDVLARPWARLVLFTVGIEGACLYGAFAFIATHLHQVFGMSLTKAGAMVMLYGFGGMLFALASRLFVKRFGETGLTLWGGLLITASLMVIGASGIWWWAVPACLLAGLGFYMLHNTLQTNATQMAPERRGAALAAFAFCYFMGQSLGVAIGGLLVEQTGTATVIIAGAAGVLVVALNFSRRLRLKSQA